MITSPAPMARRSENPALPAAGACAYAAPCARNNRPTATTAVLTNLIGRKAPLPLGGSDTGKEAAGPSRDPTADRTPSEIPLRPPDRCGPGPDQVSAGGPPPR